MNEARRVIFEHVFMGDARLRVKHEVKSAKQVLRISESETSWCPYQELNLDLPLRTGSFYPVELLGLNLYCVVSLESRPEILGADPRHAKHDGTTGA